MWMFLPINVQSIRRTLITTKGYHEIIIVVVITISMMIIMMITMLLRIAENRKCEGRKVLGLIYGRVVTTASTNFSNNRAYLDLDYVLS
jgi:hypothetical protein